MRHRIKKIKFKKGRDASKMLLRKLLVNFLTKGKIVTTLKKAKVLKSAVERLVEKSKKFSEANKNCLLKILGDCHLVQEQFKTVGTVLKDKIGGYVRVLKLDQRASDGALMAKLEWVYPVILEEKSKKKKAVEIKVDQKKVKK